MRHDKKGKNFKLKQFPNIRIEAKTEMKDPLKSVFVTISGTFITKVEEKLLELKKVQRKTSRSIYNNLNKKIFYDRYITTDLIPYTFRNTGKSFISFEYMFFIKKNMDIKVVEEELNVMSEKIYNDVYSEQGDMVFSPYYLAKKK